MPQSTSTGDWFAAEPVLEQLGRSDEEGNYVPWLAEKFETDADNLTFTITLRDGVKSAMEVRVMQKLLHGISSSM